MLRQSLLAALLAVSSTLYAQEIAVPSNMETPTEPGWFRMDLASGKLTPLEKVKPVMEGSHYSYRVYLPGLQSASVVPYEARPLFAIRLTTLSGKAPTLEEERKSVAKNPYRLEWLQPAKEGRYATKQYVPLELLTTYGDVLDLKPPRGPARATRTFVFTPQTALSPGHYAFTGIGLLTPIGSGPSLSEVHAFTVRVGAPPVAQRAAPSVAMAAPSVAVAPSIAASPSGAVDADAKASADRFIVAMKIAAEVPDAQKTVRELSWANLRLTPLIGESTLYEGMFDTDIQGIKGYKRLIDAKARNQAGVEQAVRYVLVAYKDRSSGSWKIFDIRDLNGSNSDHEVEAAAAQLDDTQYGKKQLNYRRYAYWLAFDGKVGKAKQAYDTANDLNKADPDPNWQKFETGRYQALQAITGL